MEHPVIKQVEQYGYPKVLKEHITLDSFSNEVYEGDEVYEINDEIFLIDALGYEATVILEKIGADRKRL